jgi:hypothetical protein
VFSNEQIAKSVTAQIAQRRAFEATVVHPKVFWADLG